MIGSRHATKTLIGIDCHRFRSLEALPGAHKPGEVKGINPERDPGAVILIHFDPGKEVPAVDQAEAIDFTLILICSMPQQREERILLMTAGSSAALNRLIAAGKRSSLDISFVSPGTGEVQQFELIIRQVDAHA
ncbi:hypothetical protein D3C71_1868540 [compost metagenome]